MPGLSCSSCCCGAYECSTDSLLYVICVQVILVIDKARLPGMKRLLEAGGAQVLGIRPPYAKFSEATHAFVDFGKLNKQTIDKVHAYVHKPVLNVCID